MRFFSILLLLGATAAWSQTNRGGMRLSIIDPSGAAVAVKVELASAGNGFSKTVECDRTGHAFVPLIPFGVYQIRIDQPGFAPFRENLEIRSEIPVEQRVQLSISAVHSEVTVTESGSLVDLRTPSAAMQIGANQIEQRLSSLPGRSVQDLIVSQPGWLYEGNAVLHPRGSEYQTQFVVDGIPLTDNRSAGFGPEIEADDLESITIYTAGFPAEYGRKMGGAVELNTHRQTGPGLHGSFVLSGGSYATLSGYGELQQTWTKDALSASASGSETRHFLNPVVPENYTNTGTVGDFAASYERDLNQKAKLSFSGRHELSRYQVPDELVQQQAGQVQNGDNFEDMGTARFQYIVSPNSLLMMSGMLRENSDDLESNRNPTPIAAFLHNRFTEGYFKGTYSVHHGRQELKEGLESDSTFLHENFRYAITDASQFDTDTPQALAFSDQRPDLEQAGFIEDLLRLRNWTISAGLRWDHYQLLLNRHALSPRLAVGRGFPSHNLVVHASYDRIFQTPSSENILISGSPQLSAISNQFLRLPVQPSTGNDYEVGLTKGIANRARLDVTVFSRQARNAADDDQLLNTGVSYPISFDRSGTYGAEGKLQAVATGPLTGFVSYSYMVAMDWFPVTGGLFLGQDAQAALSKIKGHFPASQDQRNTIATRWDYAVGKRLHFAAGATYGSGLPFTYGGTEAQALALYGHQVVNRLDFSRGRIRPLFALNSSVSLDLCQRDHLHMAIHIDGENLNNQLNILDFGGLFSGNALAPQRSVLLRWNSRF